ncbi:hypothetical protein [Devosia sp. LjRoot3]|uniref:hypothetical protein n=1 Tax=Devosia sp. LjRoot3 TaxID=3342319 RepID=UPI003ECF2843
MRTASVLVFIACLAISLKAEASPITNTWIDSVSRSGPASPEPWGEVKQVYNVTIGDQPVVLEETSIADLAASLGAAAQNWGEAGEATTWACLSRNAETLWLYSDGEMGGGAVTGVAIDVRDPAPASANCGTWPADLKVDLGMMGIGLPADVIAANYLTGQPDDYGWFRSTNLTDAATPPGKIWQELTFRANADGTVDAMAVMQETGD